MKTLHIKLWRDLQRLWPQVLTMALVVAIGVAGFVGMFSVHQSLQSSRDGFYRDNRLADVFIHVQRAPTMLLDRLRMIEGVAQVQLTTTMDAPIALPNAQAPVTGRFVGLDLGRTHEQQQGLNAVSLRSGRWPEPGQALEVLVSDRFAQTRQLRPGDKVNAILNGRLQSLHIVGTAISPEFVFASRGGMPDDKTFGIWWMDRERMAQTFDMQGAFNQASFRLHDSLQAPSVIAQIDALLDRYGTRGAMGRDKQMSARIVSNELSQLKVMGTVLPGIFLAVSVFILNGVITRQVATQRSQIAALKALGYTDHAIAGHYMAMSLVITGLGLLTGLLLSQEIGQQMLNLYGEFFKFKQLTYTTTPWLVVVAMAGTLAVAIAGTWGAVRTVVRLQPAEAMQAPTTPRYRKTLLERISVGRQVSTGMLMVIRNLEHRPWRSLFTVTGIALAVALQISGAFWMDTMDHIMDVQFHQVQRGDVVVQFQNAVPPSVVQDLQRMPGVIHAEANRTEAVRIHASGVSEEGVLLGLPASARLLRPVDALQGPVPVPAQGMLMSDLLARQLAVRAGDRVEVAFLAGRQTHAQVDVVGVVHTLMGQQVFMSLDAMNRLSREGSAVTEASLRVDAASMPAFWSAVKQAPVIVTVFDKASEMASFQASTSRNMGIFSGILTLFAIAMAVAIVYNSARISLSERAWELASLRVLGMTRAEVSLLLLGQLGAELLLALPVGVIAGWALASLLMRLMASDNIDFPVVIAPSTYAGAALIVLAAGLVSALLVRRKIDQLDLVAVLKVRE